MSKRIMFSLLLSLVLVALFISCEQKADKSEVKILNRDSIVLFGAKLEKVTGDIEFDTAGSPCYDNGVLYFTNNNFDPAVNSRTYKMDASGNVTVIREANGVTTSIHRTGRGTFYCCEMIGHRISEIDSDGNVLRTVAGEYDGKRLDGPNDMVIDSKGGIYFTDSRFSPGEELVQDTPAVYYVKPDGSIIRIIDDIEFPNGIDLSPDGKILYVANTRGAMNGKYVLAYDVNNDGNVSNRRNFCELKLIPDEMGKEDGSSGADGTAVDSAGNLYVATTKGIGIQVFDKEGEYLCVIPCEVVTNNCYFGGQDMKTLYVSAKDGIYKIDLKVPGLKSPLKLKKYGFMLKNRT